MNFIAHFLLAGHDEGLVIGNFLADFVRQKTVATLPADWQRGVRLHRYIDSQTDQHPALQASRERLRPHQGRYSPVVLDVYADLLLSEQWARFSPGESFADFEGRIYAVLAAARPAMPEGMAERCDFLLARRWLGEYRTWAGLERTFGRMAGQLKFPSRITEAVPALQAGHSDYTAEFLAFFPDLQAKVADFLATL